MLKFQRNLNNGIFLEIKLSAQNVEIVFANTNADAVKKRLMFCHDVDPRSTEIKGISLQLNDYPSYTN